MSEISKILDGGWVFKFEYGAVGAEHPKGGKFTIAEISKRVSAHMNIELLGEEITHLINSVKL